MNNYDFNILHSRLPICPGIMGRERYFNSAVLIPFMMMEGEYHLLFQRRAATIRQGGEICFPGGAFDRKRDRNHEDTAIRETCEELGIDRKEIRIAGRLDTLVAPMGALVEPYIGLLDASVMENLTINPEEVAGVFSLPVSFFIENRPETYSVKVKMHSTHLEKDGQEVTLLPGRELGLPEKYHRSWGGMRHRVLVWKTPEGVIWGITAEMIHDIIEKSGIPV